MGVDTGRGSGGSGLDRYWRRRVVALAMGLGAVGVLAWACADGEDEPRRRANAARSDPPPTAMPTVTVTRTVIRSAEPVAEGGRCAAKNLVVSLAASRDTYTGRDAPRFRVSVVNAGEGECTWDAGSLDVRVASGDDRIWSSARCRRGGGGRAENTRRTLRRGIPYVDTVGWDRRRGCGGARVRPGTYVVALKGAGKQVFQLR
ncbi:hypothetical protein [Actinomadura litoris]|uniref:DUF4232 domain-containing protein n=1 Tax=Actinomadura litoris TaxID=2678616 RepID=A0A7K1KTR6_9ACTN|nr:hypothetical protein [Actinomadura litoris]MUN35588.1 hypothetical protein [Actinomadura litoris]